MESASLDFLSSPVEDKEALCALVARFSAPSRDGAIAEALRKVFGLPSVVKSEGEANDA